MSLVAATRSETTKLTTTGGWWILAIVLVGYLGVTAAALAFVIGAAATGAIGTSGRTPLPTTGIAPLLYSLASSVGYVFPLLIGTLIVTTEFRHQTLTPTFLAIPRRGMVLSAKMIVGVAIGVVYAVLALVATVGPVAGILAGFGRDTSLGSGDAWAQFARVLLAFAVWALVGIGVGTLLRNQVAAIVVVLVFTQFVGPILQVAATFVSGLQPVTRYLPGAASDALVGSSILSASALGASSSPPLEWWQGGLVLAAYAVVFLGAGYLVSWRRDVS
ncbi:ABC transporter permease [Microbacterium sp. X-17]|uniref:ABC transporter permease n=1 Tax=Microbacterium sp. X-17 TaxID=3144404 RepID=UPI0031F492DE